MPPDCVRLTESLLSAISGLDAYSPILYLAALYIFSENTVLYSMLALASANISGVALPSI